MKYFIITIVFFLCSFNINADDFHCSETVLINRGYTKFDPTVYYDTHILDDCYEKIFNKSFFEIKGFMRVLLDDDGFLFSLYYLLEEDYKVIELPNILVIVYLKNEDKIYGYYKMNLNLEAEEEVSTTRGDLSVFF